MVRPLTGEARALLGSPVRGAVTEGDLRGLYGLIVLGQQHVQHNGHKGCGHDAALAADQLQELRRVCQDAGFCPIP